jgi:hypothetical protein
MAMDGLSDMGSVVIRGYIHTFAAILRYIFPMIFFFGRGGGVVRETFAFDGIGVPIGGR